MPLSIDASSRLAGVGKTGSGKTHAIGLLALALPRFLCIDPKGTLGDSYRRRANKYLWNLADWHTSAGEQARQSIERGGPGRLRVPAPLDNDYEPYFKWAYEQGGLTVYIDEMYAVASATRPGPWLTALYTRGRELGIGTWAATQRPRRVPVFMLSEAEWLLVFRLSIPDDRKRMAEEIGPDGLVKLTGHSFWLYNDEWDAPRFYTKLTERAR